MAVLPVLQKAHQTEDDMTRQQARETARKFVDRYIKTGRQWRTWDIETCLPDGIDLRADAEFCDNPTITNIANFVQYAVHDPH